MFRIINRCRVRSSSRKLSFCENGSFSWCSISLQVSSSKTSFGKLLTRPHLAPIEPESTLLTSSLTQLISHVPRLSCHLLTHLLTLTSSASNPCRARVRRPYSPSFVLINQRSNKKVCHHKTLSHLLLLTLSPIPYGILHARYCSSHAPSLKLVASSAQ